MSIRSRTLAIISLTLLVLAGVLYAFSQLILLEGYLQLEEEAVEQNVQRAVNAFQEKIAFYHNTSVDYAHWDDTYAYMQGLNDRYTRDNILASVFSNYDLEFILFVSTTGEIVFSQGYAPDQQELVPVGADLMQAVASNDALVLPRDADGNVYRNGISGIVQLQERSVVLATTPILLSDETGEPVGVLIWGRGLDESLVDNLSNQTQLSLSLHPVADTDTPAADSPSIAINRLSDQLITGSIVLYDIYGVPSLTLQVDGHRGVFQQGQNSITYFLVSLVLMSLIAAGGIAIMLERTVLSRIANLNTHVSRIRQSSDVAERVAVTGDDEVSSLATNINGMLESLQTQEKIKLARDNALEASRLKAEILANVSHDARTPLSVIILRVELLLNGMYGPLTDKQRDVFRQILFNSDQLMGFVENLLEGSQLDAGKLHLNIAEFQPAQLLDHTRRTLEPLAHGKNLRLEMEISSDVPERLMGDGRRVERIVNNLVSNAIKFTHEGSVNLRIWRSDPAHWGIEVRDSGIGISDENQRRIFDAFWQVDASTTRAANSGVGLGLSIVRQLTELMNGTISVTSQVGSGSIFTVTLPIHESVNGPDNEQLEACIDR